MLALSFLASTVAATLNVAGTAIPSSLIAFQSHFTASQAMVDASPMASYNASAGYLEFDSMCTSVTVPTGSLNLAVLDIHKTSCQSVWNAAKLIRDVSQRPDMILVLETPGNDVSYWRAIPAHALTDGIQEEDLFAPFVAVEPIQFEAALQAAATEVVVVEADNELGVFQDFKTSDTIVAIQVVVCILFSLVAVASAYVVHRGWKVQTMRGAKTFGEKCNLGVQISFFIMLSAALWTVTSSLEQMDPSVTDLTYIAGPTLALSLGLAMMVFFSICLQWALTTASLGMNSRSWVIGYRIFTSTVVVLFVVFEILRVLTPVNFGLVARLPMFIMAVACLVTIVMLLTFGVRLLLKIRETSSIIGTDDYFQRVITTQMIVVAIISLCALISAGFRAFIGILFPLTFVGLIIIFKSMDLVLFSMLVSVLTVVYYIQSRTFRGNSTHQSKSKRSATSPEDASDLELAPQSDAAIKPVEL